MPQNKIIKGAKIGFAISAGNKLEETPEQLLMSETSTLFRNICASAHIDVRLCSVFVLVKDEAFVLSKDFKNSFFEGKFESRELKLYKELLKREVMKDKPNILVPLDDLTLRVFFDEANCEAWRGSVLYYEPFKLKVMPTLYVGWARYTSRAIVQHDLERAHAESHVPELSRRKRELILEPSLPQVSAYLNECMVSSATAFDIETSGQTVTAISFAHTPELSICIPFYRDFEHYWNKNDELVVWWKIKELFKSHTRTIAQNALYDIPFLKAFYDIEVKNLWMDRRLP